MTQRPTLETYVEWAGSNLSTRFDAWEKMVYLTNAQAIQRAAANQEFFREIRSILGAASRDFEREVGARLLTPSPSADLDLQLKSKSYESALEKSFRMNVVRNKNFPSEPPGGWVRPPTWYGRLNDIVRGTLVCGYMDGLPWLAERLRNEAERRGLRVTFNSEQRDEGYYAFHVYVTLPSLKLQVREGDNSIAENQYDVAVEIQLTTQLQDALREVTHFFYEERRVHGLIPDWKWHHDAPQFRASYISHTLHLLDAIIVELRDGVKSARAGAVPEVSSDTQSEEVTTRPSTRSDT